MTEEWKDIKGYEGLYKISNLGRVKSLTRNTVKEHIMKQSENDRYKTVELFNNGIGKRKLVHRLVAENFIANLNNYNQVNHKDENKFNNHATNLEWCTSKYNMNYGSRIQKCVKKLREKTTRKVFSKGDKRLFVSLPIQAIKELDIKAGDTVDMKVENKRVIITKIKKESNS